jgi:hypothetical protein
LLHDLMLARCNAIGQAPNSPNVLRERFVLPRGTTQAPAFRPGLG